MILRGFKRSTPPRRSGSSGCSGSRHRFATPPRPRSSPDSIGTRGSRNTSRNSSKTVTCSACAARSARSPPSPLEIASAFRYRVALEILAASVQMKQVIGPRDMSAKQVWALDLQGKAPQLRKLNGSRQASKGCSPPGASLRAASASEGPA